jgi:hypothetical protein
LKQIVCHTCFYSFLNFRRALSIIPIGRFAIGEDLSI